MPSLKFKNPITGKFERLSIPLTEGKDGITPHIGNNNNWWIGDIDTGVKALGTPGDPGEPGEDGLTPYVGTNGNWFIGTTDTGVQAHGEKGDPGEDGLTPYVGTNGNWFIGTVDTGVQAAGQTTTTIQTVTLTATGWANLSQTVSCPGILVDDTKQVITTFPDIADKRAYMDAHIVCTDNGANSLTFTAKIVPTTDILVYVTIEEAGSGPLEVYSTEERVVGTWIDGKPIYQQLIFTTVPNVVTSGTWVWKQIPLNCDVDTPFPVKGYFLSATELLTFPHFGDDPNIGRMRATIAFDANEARVGSNALAWNGCPVVLFVEYTKTTDTATVAIPSVTALMDAYNEGVNEA